MTITNDKKFPHAFAIKRLGGKDTAEGEKYYEDHEEELSKEYSEIMEALVTRAEHLGGLSKIHKTD